jgi:hypothetical protein
MDTAEELVRIADDLREFPKKSSVLALVEPMKTLDEIAKLFDTLYGDSHTSHPYDVRIERSLLEDAGIADISVARNSITDLTEKIERAKIDIESLMSLQPDLDKDAFASKRLASVLQIRPLSERECLSILVPDGTARFDESRAKVAQSALSSRTIGYAPFHRPSRMRWMR